jgi:hypothetical protein
VAVPAVRLMGLRFIRSAMATTHTCPCGATLRYEQDLDKEPGTTGPTWKCKDCGTQVPGLVAERIRHQDPQ